MELLVKLLPFLFVILAASCNAIMDILENENFLQSKFKHKNPAFWYKRESWKFAKKIFGYKIDAWHLFKSAMIMLILIPISSSILEYILLGVVWNLTFNIIYKQLKQEK